MDSVLGTRQGLLLRRLGDQSEAELAMGMLATARRIDDEYNALLTEHDLSGGRFAALLAVSEMPGITPARLSDHLEVKRATVTGLIDGLVKRGLVVRGDDESDRRVQTLSTTSAGERRVREVLPRVERWLRDLIAGIDRDVAWPLVTLINRNLGSGGGV